MKKLSKYAPQKFIWMLSVHKLAISDKIILRSWKVVASDSLD